MSTSESAKESLKRLNISNRVEAKKSVTETAALRDGIDTTPSAGAAVAPANDEPVPVKESSHRDVPSKSYA